MPLRGCVHPVTGESVPLDQIPDEWLPPEVVLALTQPDRVGYGISDLTVCPRRKVREMLVDFYLPVDSCFRLIRGKAWDALCGEFPRPGGIYQASFARQLLGVDLKGHPDLLDPGRLSIEDYKAPDKNPRGDARPGYQIQLNGYVWLSEGHRDWEVEKLCLNIVGPTKFVRCPVPVWKVDVTQDLLSYKLRDLKDLYEAGDTRLCDDPDCYLCRQDCLWVEK